MMTGSVTLEEQMRLQGIDDRVNVGSGRFQTASLLKRMLERVSHDAEDGAVHRLGFAGDRTGLDQRSENLHKNGNVALGFPDILCEPSKSAN